MKMVDVDPFDELFTHVHDDTGVQTTYAVTPLFAYITAHEHEVACVSVPVEDEHAQYCRERRGVEEDRIDVLMTHIEYLRKPIVFIAMPDGTHLLVDGTHRYVIYHMAKAQFIPAYIVPWAVAAPFIVEDFPTSTEDELMQWSGLTLLRKLQHESSN